MPLLTFLRRLMSPAAPSPGGAEGRRVPSAEGEQATTFDVLICPIDGTGGEVATAAVMSVFGMAGGNSGGLLAVRPGASPGSCDDTETSPTTLGRLIQRARAVAESQDAAVSVCGQMTGPTTVRLRFIPTTVSSDPASGIWSACTMIDLPVPFPPGAAPLVLACTAAALVLPDDDARRRRLAVLRDAMRDAEPLLQGEDAPVQGPARTLAALAYGAVLTEMGLRTSQSPLVERARKMLRAAVARAKAGEVLPPAAVAAGRFALAEALIDGALADRDMDRLEEAARHLRLAADVVTVPGLADDNAAIWALYGRTLHRLSSLSGSVDHMKEAVHGYRQAATIWTKARDEERWAELAHGMATVLSQFGEFTGTAQAFDRSAALFAAVAQVWTREANPRRWASLQNNIGACRFAQGKRSGALPTLREAAECFSLALEVYRALGITSHVHVTQKNIARVERLIAVQESKAGN